MRLTQNIMRTSARWVAAMVLGGVAIGAQAQQFKPLETLTDGQKLSADAQDRIYVMDTVFMHMTESRVHVFDGKTGRFLGMIPTSFNGHMQLSNDGKKIYTMTTYHERVTRGKRTDVVEIWDAQGLTFEKEIILPNNRVQGLNYRNMFRQTTDGKFIILQNATPAISVAVVDVEKGEHVEEITAVAGCWSVNPLPNRPRSFMTVCGDGTLLTIDLDENGKVASQYRSERMFSVQDDPVFIAQAMVNNKANYVSFYGTMYTADFNGDKVTFEPSWSLLDEQDRAAGWTPGGYNLLAADEGKERLYVLMHSGGAEGTHKSPAEEIWVYDLPTKKRIARVPGMGILSISVDEPGQRLLGIDGGNVHIFDISGDTPTLIRTIENAGEAALQVEPHVVMKNGG
ncbi:MAG: amine dehydrogenase large subunit [Paenalcaligenes sp.]